MRRAPSPGEAQRAAEEAGEYTPSPRRLKLTRASEIKPRPVTWAWEDGGQGRIPAGALGLAAGREGTGKSSFAIWLTAQITTGKLPGSLAGTPRAVMYVAVEDSWEHTLVPRLIAAGADLEHVYRTEVETAENETVSLSLPVDNRILEQDIRQTGAAMVVLDPLMSAISETLDTHVNRQVRQALDPLARLADRTGAIMFGIAHFSKAAGTDVSSLITGSGAFKDVARCIFGFAADEDSESAGVITQTKNSLGRSRLPSLAYHIVESVVETEEGPTKTGRFVMDGETDRTAADILGAREGDREERDEKSRAGEFLRDVLEDGPRRSKEVEEEAREVHGISLRTFKRARADLGLPVARRESGPVGREGKRKQEWWVSLPGHEAELRAPYKAPEASKGANGATASKRGNSGTLGTLGTLDESAGETKSANGATPRVPAENAVNSEECQSANSAKPPKGGTEPRWIARRDPSAPNPMPKCGHKACVDALVGECLADRGVCVGCGSLLSTERRDDGFITHRHCAEDGGKAA